MRNISSLAHWCGCTNSGTSSNEKEVGADRIVMLKILFLSSFLIAAISLPVATWFRLSESEEDGFEGQFRTLAKGGLRNLVDDFEGVGYHVKGLASAYAFMYPNASQWPHVAWHGFYPTASLLQNATSVFGFSMSPIVQPHQAKSYAAFISAYYDSDPFCPRERFIPQDLPDGTIWRMDFDAGIRCPDVFGNSTDSKYQVLMPIAQYTASALKTPALVGFNIHSNPLYSGFLDQLQDCVAAHDYDYAIARCGALSLSNTSPRRTPEDPNPVVTDMAVIFAQPVIPVNDKTVLVATTAATLSWSRLLANAFAKDVHKVDCVVETSTGCFTYSIDHGIPQLLGQGDLHDTDYSYMREDSFLLQPNSTATDSSSYRIAFYPTKELHASYRTRDPLVNAITMLAIFLFCAILFALYDILMRRAFDRHQAVLDTKRRFVRFISHEIRTPLNTVSLGMKLIDVEVSKFAASLHEVPLQDLPAVVTAALASWKSLADEIVQSSDSAVEVLNDLLNYDKIEIGTLKLEFACFDVRDTVRRTISMMQVQAQQKNISLQVGDTTAVAVQEPQLSLECAEEGYTAIGDAVRMGQVLRNLISNALKFTPARGIVEVSVSATAQCAALPDRVRRASPLFRDTQQCGTLRVAVKDSGAGLTPKQLEEICAEGVQFNANELQAGQGSGLGLFISKGIVEQHGGRLVVTSEGLGKGVTFTVELPLFRYEGLRSVPLAPDSDEQGLRFTTSAIDSPSARSRYHPAWSERSTVVPAINRVLVVDDSAFSRKMVVRLLQTQDYICEQAEDGADALKKYSEMVERNEAPDAILMDFEMPVMNGPTATAKLREMGCTCLIVGVTGNVLPEQVNIFKNHGADTVLAKPLQIDQLSRLLQEGSSELMTASSAPFSEKPTNLEMQPSKRGSSRGIVHPVAAVDEGR